MTAPHLPTAAHVLLLEDDPIQVLELMTSLTDAGASVVGPHAGVDDAKRTVGETHCDGAIIDLRLGDMNSSGFANFLHSKRIPFVIFSAYPDSAHLRLEGTAWEFMQKPADADRVVRCLFDLIARTKSTRQQ